MRGRVGLGEAREMKELRPGVCVCVCVGGPHGVLVAMRLGAGVTGTP